MAQISRLDGVGKGNAHAFLQSLKDNIHFAMQPIVHMHSGVTYGFEALLRGHDKAGFSSIADVFDKAWNAGILHQCDMVLREIAIRQFGNCENAKRTNLFYNLDGRIFESKDYHPHLTGDLLTRVGIPPESFVLELSEQYDNAAAMHVSDTLDMCRQHDYKLAIDDYGQGFSEMMTLFEHQPDFIKIDRFFITDIDRDSKKRLFVSAIVNLAHSVSTAIIAEGIETEKEFLACKSIGCDLAQGYYVAKPSISPRDLEPVYDVILDTNRRDRRERVTDAAIIKSHLIQAPAISFNDSHEAIFNVFRRNKSQKLFPVIDKRHAPLGVLRESDLKKFLYLKAGQERLDNSSMWRRLQDFLMPCPVADIHTPVERLLHLYTMASGTEGILITDSFEHLGLIDANALLRMINDKRVAPKTEPPSSVTPLKSRAVDKDLGLPEDNCARCLKMLMR